MGVLLPVCKHIRVPWDLGPVFQSGRRDLERLTPEICNRFAQVELLAILDRVVLSALLDELSSYVEFVRRPLLHPSGPVDMRTLVQAHALQFCGPDRVLFNLFQPEHSVLVMFPLFHVVHLGDILHFGPAFISHFHHLYSVWLVSEGQRIYQVAELHHGLRLPVVELPVQHRDKVALVQMDVIYIHFLA